MTTCQSKQLSGTKAAAVDGDVNWKRSIKNVSPMERWILCILCTDCTSTIVSEAAAQKCIALATLKTYDIQALKTNNDIFCLPRLKRQDFRFEFPFRKQYKQKTTSWINRVERNTLNVNVHFRCKLGVLCRLFTIIPLMSCPLLR